MGYDLRNAALIACCVLAIVVGAAFFPAAGYGDFPDREAVGEDHYLEDGTPEPGTGESRESNESDDEGDDDGEEERGDDERNDDGEDEQDDEGDERDEDREDDDGENDDDEASIALPSGTDTAMVFLGRLFAFGIFLGFVALLWQLTDPTRSPGVTSADLPDGFVPRLRLRLGRIPQLTMAATIGASSALPKIADSLARTTRGVGSGIGTVARDVGRGLGSSLAAAPAGLARSLRGFGTGFSLTGSLSSLFDGLSRRRSRGSTDSNRKRATETEPVVDPLEPEIDDGPRTIAEAWEELRDAVPMNRRYARTPGEYARRAVSYGLPEGPVSRLTEAFREVRYGGYPPSPDRTRRAREAYQEIDEAVNGGDDE